MSEHLNQDLLIQYQFELLSDDEQKTAAAHLQSCPQCRKELENLCQRYTALDLLQDDVAASQKLIDTTLADIANGTNSASSKPMRLYKPVWLTAAASVMIVLGGLLFHFMDESQDRVVSPTEKDDRTPLLDENGNDRPTTESYIIPEGIKADSDPVTINYQTQPNPTPRQNPTDERYIKLADWIPEKPPFAPASNIELNTLPRREDVQITIYNSADLTLVREKRQLTMKRGWNWLQFMWANTLIDPTSLSLEPLQHREQIEVEQLVFPPRLKELGRWLIKSQVSGQVPFEITYFTSGLSWRAFYMGTLTEDESSMTLKGCVRVDNGSGEDYENAQTRLLVGKVNLLDKITDLARRDHAWGEIVDGEWRKGLGVDKYRSWHFGDDGVEFDGDVDHLSTLSLNDSYALFAKMPEKKDIKKEGLSEYFLYTIEGTETIPNGWGIRLPSFEIEDIPVESLYKYDEELYGRQPIRFVSFANDTEHELGETPLPNGNIKLFRTADAEAHLAYLGGSNVKYIPVNEEIELNLGPARLVKVEPTMMATETMNYMFDNKKNISGWDEEQKWRIAVNNTGSLPIELEVTRAFPSTYWRLELLGGGVEYSKHDANHARFTRTLAPQTKINIDYKIRIGHGKRQEFYTIEDN